MDNRYVGYCRSGSLRGSWVSGIDPLVRHPETLIEGYGSWRWTCEPPALEEEQDDGEMQSLGDEIDYFLTPEAMSEIVSSWDVDRISPERSQLADRVLFISDGGGVVGEEKLVLDPEVIAARPVKLRNLPALAALRQIAPANSPRAMIQSLRESGLGLSLIHRAGVASYDAEDALPGKLGIVTPLTFVSWSMRRFSRMFTDEIACPVLHEAGRQVHNISADRDPWQELHAWHLGE